MGGRGGSSRGKSSGATIIMQSQPQQPQPQTQAPPKLVDAGEFSKFMKMTDDQKADALAKLLKEDVPVFLANNAFQKLTYAIGGNDKPQLVSDAVLNKTKGTEIFRTVNNVRDTRNGITYDADMIASQIQKGSVTRVSDSGGSVYGRGIYFAQGYRNSTAYGSSSSSIKKTAVVRAKISSSAKTISYSSASSLVRKEIASGSKLGKVLSKCDSASQPSIYALSKGYSVMSSGNGYYNVLSRKALIMSSDVKAMSSKW